MHSNRKQNVSLSYEPYQGYPIAQSRALTDMPFAQFTFSNKGESAQTMAENPQDEKEIFICGSGGETIQFPATTIAELNPGKPVREFVLPKVIHLAAASLKGELVSLILNFFFHKGYIFLLGGAVVYGHSYSRILTLKL